MDNTTAAAIIGGEYKNWNRYSINPHNILISGNKNSAKTGFILGELLGLCAETGRKLLYIFSSKEKRKTAENHLAALPSYKRTAAVFMQYSDIARWIRKYTYIGITYGYDIANAVISSSSHGNFFTAEINPILFSSIFPAGVNTPTGSYTSWQRLKVQYHERRQNSGNGAYSFLCTFTYGKYSVFSEIRNSLGFLPSAYDYAVLDDIYDVIREGSFSYDATDVMKMIIQSSPPKYAAVFMTALCDIKDTVVSETLDYHIRLFGEQHPLKKYIIPQDFNDVSACTITSDAELAEKIQNSGNSRWIILTDAKKRGEKLNEKLLSLGIPSRFICSENRTKNNSNTTKCVITSSLTSDNVFKNGECFDCIAVSSYENSEILMLMGSDYINNGKPLQVCVSEHSERELGIYRQKLSEKQSMLDEAERLAYNVGASFSDEWQKFHFIAKYCNNKRMFDKINGIIRFNSNGIELNTIALCKNRHTIRQFDEILKHSFWENSLARMQLYILDKDYHSQNPFISRITELLSSRMNASMDNSELKALKIKLNEIIIKINTMSIYPMKKVNETSSTASLNEWLCGMGIRFGITTGIAEKHNKKRYYKIVPLDDEQFSAFDKACHSKYYPHIPYENRKKNSYMY